MTDETTPAVLEALKDRLRGKDGEEYTDRGMEDAFFRWPVIERELRAALSPTPRQPEPSKLAGELERLIDRIMSLSTPMMEGDNLAIVLCSFFENPEQDVCDDTGWTDAATTGYEEVRAAIQDHFSPILAALAKLDGEVT